MLYISIPEGYRLEENSDGHYLVSKTSDTHADISLEKAVQSYFERKSTGLVISDMPSPFGSYVEYCPIDQGQKKAGWVKVCEGKDKLEDLLFGAKNVKYTDALPFGTLLREIEEAASADRLENKRHTGDSPWAT